MMIGVVQRDLAVAVPADAPPRPWPMFMAVGMTRPMPAVSSASPATVETPAPKTGGRRRPLASPLNPTDLDLLVLVRHAEETVIARRLPADLSLTEAAVSRRVAGLERIGLLRRTSHPFDGRSQQIVLTEEGRGVIDDLFPRWLATARSLVAGLGADGRAEVEGALAALVGALQQPGPGERH